MQICTLKYSYYRIRFKKQDLSICCLLGIYIKHKKCKWVKCERQAKNNANIHQKETWIAILTLGKMTSKQRLPGLTDKNFILKTNTNPSRRHLKSKGIVPNNREVDKSLFSVNHLVRLKWLSSIINKCHVIYFEITSI